MRDHLFGTVWRRMIVLKVVIIVAMLAYKTQHYPYMGYQHLLVDYHFGFIKRALIGELWLHVFPRVPVWAVFITGAVPFLIALALFIAVFRRRFGFDDAHLPLFVFTACSPMLFGNFMQTIGYFDIYGCIAGLLLLLIPARSFAYVVLAATLAMLLVVIHHIQTLMYVPALSAIVVVRYYLARPRRRVEMLAGLAMLLPVAVLFGILQFIGSPPIPEADFHAYMLSRIAGRTDVPVDPGIWYQSARSEVERTWAMMGKNALRIPIYLAVFAAHAPLIVYFRRLVAALDDRVHRRIVWLAAVLVSCGYVVMFAVVSDYARWVSNWFVCMVLLLFAIRELPAAEAVAIRRDDSRTRVLGWIVTAIPRIGSTMPF